MKKFIVLAACVLSTQVFAATVRVNSFNWIRPSDPLAEICGTVEDASAVPSFVRLVVDNRSNRPAVYNAVVGADGKFCLAVVSYRGTAQLSVFGEEGSFEFVAK